MVGLTGELCRVLPEEAVESLRGLGVACIIRSPHPHPGRCFPSDGNLRRACGRSKAILLDLGCQARSKSRRVGMV